MELVIRCSAQASEKGQDRKRTGKTLRLICVEKGSEYPQILKILRENVIIKGKKNPSTNIHFKQLQDPCLPMVSGAQKRQF